jgi:hypothetical protein
LDVGSSAPSAATGTGPSRYCVLVADAGDRDAARQLAERGDLGVLRTLADADDGVAGEYLPWQLTEQGRAEEAERLKRFGLNPDGSIADE